MTTAHLNEDVVLACVDLVGRAGAKGFEMGYVHDDVPVEEAGWYAHALYQGARLLVQDHRSPSAAALALAERILGGGTCRCGRPVALADAAPGCRWRLAGKRWEPGCDAQPLHVDGKRGDWDGMNRAMRRRQARRAR